MYINSKSKVYTIVEDEKGSLRAFSWTHASQKIGLAVQVILHWFKMFFTTWKLQCLSLLCHEYRAGFSNLKEV